MGSGTEVAKDASDIVILNDSFSAIGTCPQACHVIPFNFLL